MEIEKLSLARPQGGLRLAPGEVLATDLILLILLILSML